MNKITKTIVSLLVIVLILGIAFYPKVKKTFFAEKKAEGKEKSKGGPGGGKGGKTTVVVMVVKSTRLDDMINSTGSILPNEEVEIRSEIAGRIIQLNIKEGDVVQKGTILLHINDDDLQARLRKLGYNKKLAEDNEARQKVLLQKEAISQREYDIAVNSVNTISADIEDLKAQILKTTIRAPFSGTVGFRYVSMGSYISPTTKIATLTNTNPAKIEFSIPAKYASQIRKGNTIEFVTENETKTYSGKVYAIDPKIDPLTRTLQIRALSPNPGGVLVPGAFAKVNLILKTKGSAILVPTEAVIPESKGSKVFIVKNGKAVSTKVELGTRGEKTVEILSGLSIGDTLITNGIIQVKPDGEVDIKEVVQ
ncbi:efflux RND transporter periplasmic adaptor subunit [Aquirufa aurantiipilula]|uniref:Efflux RND transporter periplasmic adaptor subunit n=1 Tax=Aquirufa aurantiipilula TaxID=2696561 RepID=A0ABT6BPD3_9BACT|nr:efflux RND transporter periplasmic adaptor subunit [Aquirufa aurantiipilula]MBZ1327377.1 efflux RND transporter periplasmic adaptor subunit [Aquirufa aurantiipilula]MDF5690943.1 efflux RND transporter periplasmic adaptor subunit [Aquirufa aurantiipilula]